MTIIATNITARQGGFELRDISFSLHNNENMLITGASGSGKTMLAMALSGRLFVAGSLKKEYATDTDLLPETVYVEQRYTVRNRSNTVDGYYQQRYNGAECDDSYTVAEELHAVSDDEERIDFLLHELSVAYLKNKPLLQLSSGEHKRFQLIKALLRPSQLLILDDPFTGLDADGRVKLNMILNVVADGGTMLILVAGMHHPLPDCMTHVLALDGGRQTAFTKKRLFIPAQRCTTHALSSSSLPLQRSKWDFENAILMKNVTVEYDGKTILNNISWQVKKGERWLLKGRNGAGKSTLMSLVVADNPQAYANEIYLFDRRRGTGETIWDIKRNIGFVSPELCAYFDRALSCFDTVASGFFDTTGVYRTLSVEQTRHIHHWLKALDVASLAQKRLSEVSSGAQRLFLLIRSIIKQPPLLILDEPCQGLDESQTELFIHLVDDICSQSDTTIVYVSHYENDVPACISHVLELEGGTIMKR